MGTVVYEQKIDIHKNLPLEMEGMKDQIPQYRESQHQLTFADQKALYESVKKKDGEQTEGHRNGNRRMKFGRRVSGKRFVNLTEQVVIATKDLMGKKFLVTGTPTQYKWKITGKSKQVGSYLCQEATWRDSTSQVVAWFTPMIPVQAGPADYGGLPGLILHLDINDGDRVITATEVILGEVDKAKLTAPTEGEEISEEEWIKLREEKMEEMRKEFGGKGKRGRSFFMRKG